MDLKRWMRRSIAVGVVGAAYCSVTLAATVLPGGTLILGNSYTASSPTTASTTGVTNNDLTMNTSGGSYFYGDGFGGPQTAITAAGVPANTFGFYDNYVFTITGSNADTITSTVSLGSGGSGTQIINLDAQLFQVTGNPNLPSFTPSNTVNDTLSTTSFTLAPGVTSTTVILDPTAALAAGEYVLEIRGQAAGAAGGAYSGVLNVTPVPVPASAWLLISGLGGAGLFARKRRTA